MTKSPTDIREDYNVSSKTVSNTLQTSPRTPESVIELYIAAMAGEVSPDDMETLREDATHAYQNWFPNPTTTSIHKFTKSLCDTYGVDSSAVLDDLEE